MSGNRQERRKQARRKGADDGTVSIEQALALALRMHQEGFRAGDDAALRDARTLYERILAADPDRVEALHFMGVLLHQRGEDEAAVASIRRAVALRPGDADIHNNLGNVLKEQGRPQEASRAYEQALALRPDHVDALNNLGVVLKTANRLDEAVAAYERALALSPLRVDLHNNIANALQRQGKRNEAIGHYRQAVALDPLHPESKKLLGLALYHSGRVAEAVEVFKSWVEQAPDNPVAKHMLAAASGEGVPERAPDEYVKKSFDAMATSFDEHLAELGYRAPELVMASLKADARPPDGTLTVLDAGCGTGLCGPLLRPYARRLVGVDLSGGMLAKARPRGVYDALLEVELTAFLKTEVAHWDLIVSADTLCYFGDLREVIGAAARSMKASGRLSFTVERRDESRGGSGLEPHGRYSHSEAYVREVLAEAGLALRSLQRDTLRQERGEGVEGLVVLAVKAA